VYGLMRRGGVLTTYCAKGDVRRAMLAAGFGVEKLQGPPGKRHILRAVKE
jgi:tRNA U34 5-methylaminomethyl-2-thiouridine-forming methyltransferase MnmC